ncbi:MAG: hypothetical protein QOE13_1380 [Gaiellaceae bacterium]|nr:hypothetical protein [Gaiellaceae bacterium]
MTVSAAAVGSVAVLLAVVNGCSREQSSRSGSSPYVGSPTSPAQSAAPQTAAPQANAETAPQTGAQTTGQTPGDAAFWQLISETRSAAGNDTGRQSELLKDRLTQLPAGKIIAFAQTRHLLDQRAYTWSLWGAASVIEDGCSDDCFRDFRAYVISLGRGPYESALRNPDSLASVARDAESGDWENADNVAPDAYSSVTGNDFPLDDSDLSGRPAGTPLNLSSTSLRSHYPLLARRFRGA